MIPPVAGLVYAVDDPRRASFYPLASFSPEWVALRWALANGAGVRSIDLPETHGIAIRSSASPSWTGSRNGSCPRRPATRVSAATRLTALAHAAGYDDPERWREDAVEQRTGSVLERFAAITAAVAELRRDETAVASVIGNDGALDLAALADPVGPAITALREAAMRKSIRTALKGDDERIAVVCGAWHSPALEPETFPAASVDYRLLRGLPKTKVSAAWVPWTASRLSYASGYGAGVSSPGWYRHLFEHARSGSASDVATVWLVRAAQELRRQGIDASTASVVEAARLAAALAAVRGRPLAGLAELDDAALSVLADGNPLPLTLVHDRLVVGEDVGSVPDSAPLTPLAADLARAQKAARLRPAANAQTLTLDLRTDAGRARSTLLHRMLLLGIPWGRPADAGRTTGTFKEAWELSWTPELAVAVVERACPEPHSPPPRSEGRAVRRRRVEPRRAVRADPRRACRPSTPVHAAWRGGLAERGGATAHAGPRGSSPRSSLWRLVAATGMCVASTSRGALRRSTSRRPGRRRAASPAAVGLDEEAAAALRSACSSPQHPRAEPPRGRAASRPLAGSRSAELWPVRRRDSRLHPRAARRACCSTPPSSTRLMWRSG